MWTWLTNWFRGSLKSATGTTRVTSEDFPQQMPHFIDQYRRLRTPSPAELVKELKNVVYACVTMNATACAGFPPTLMRGEEVVTQHPILDLFRSVNEIHNSFDLWELTTLYQEVTGHAYWLIEWDHRTKLPERILPIPAHLVTPRRERSSSQIVDWYEYHNGSEVQRLSPKDVIHFRYPDPRNPYLGGLSPLQAAYESAELHSTFLAYKRSVWDNQALPSVIISPEEFIGEEEKARMEQEWNNKFNRGGNGRVLVAGEKLKVDLIKASLADVAQLAEAGATKEDIANVFGIPIAFLTTATNLANLQASEHEHLTKAVRPRVRRRDDKLNERLLPMFGAGDLRFHTEVRTPVEIREERVRESEDLRNGVITVNEIRAKRGLPRVPWGDDPFNIWIEAISAEETGERARQRATGENVEKCYGRKQHVLLS